MGKNGALAAVLLILVISRASDASKLRVLMAEGKEDDKPSTQNVSPSPTPDPSPKTAGAGKSNGTNHKGQPESGGPASVPPLPSGSEGCDAASEKCRVADLVACLKHTADVSKELFLLVQNTGEDALNVTITTSTVEKLRLAKHSADKVNISTNAADVIKIVLNAGNENCTLHIRPSVSDWMKQFPAYAARLTPIHGAYFLFFSMVIAGGTWACCKFGRKSRRGDAGVPYQQLEMGTLPESSSSVAAANTADGWDQSWDDAWDEEEGAVRPSEKHPTGNVSSNGLVSRPPNKDGWDVHWDD